MAEWLVEEGIGEERGVRLAGSQIVAARLHWPGALVPGQVETATLVARTADSARGTARFASGEETLVDHLPAEASEGAPIKLEVTRAALAERGRLKLAQARPTGLSERTAPALAEMLENEGHTVRVVRHFPECGWDELWAEASQGETAFAGGALALFDTPAMTLIDVDGPDNPKRLANAAVEAVASAIRRFDLGGSIGVDFPTVHAKADRKFVDALLAAALADWPHERTAMNGFGFVQIVSRRERASILNLLTTSRVGAAARMVLRRAELLEGAGTILLTVHPAVKAKLKPEWLTELARRTGRGVAVETDPGIALGAGHAQMVAR